MVISPKYDNDYITYGYYKKNGFNGEEIEKIEEEIKNIPKSYSSPPSPPYNIGDTLYYNNKVYRCITKRDVGSFDINDWEIVIESENDVDYNNWLEVEYDINNLNIDEQTDDKIETWYQNTDPSLSWVSDLDKTKHISDYWYNGNNFYKYVKNDTTPITYSWVEVKITDSIFNTTTGHKNIFIRQPINYSQYDLWCIKEIDGSLPNSASIGDWYYATRNMDSIFDENDFLKYNTNIKLEQTKNLFTTNDKLENNILNVETNYRQEIKTSIDNFNSEVIQENYYTKDGILEQIETQGTLINQSVNSIVLGVSHRKEDVYTKDQINNINSGEDEEHKVSYFKSTLLTIDDEGLKVEQAGVEAKTVIDAEGLKVYDGDGTTELLEAHLEDGEGVVHSKNIYLDKYLHIGKNSRFQDAIINNEDCTACYWLS